VSIIAHQLQELLNQGTTQAIQSTIIPIEAQIPVTAQTPPQTEAQEAEPSQQGVNPMENLESLVVNQPYPREILKIIKK